MSRLLATCVACAAAYFAWVLSVVAPHAPRLFAPRFGRGHRLAGAAHLVLLLVGVYCERPYVDAKLDACMHMYVYTCIYMKHVHVYI